MSESHRWSVSVAGAVVREDGKFLAIKRRDNGHWEPPGGLVEHGESLLEAVRREIREETGYEVEAQHVSGVYQNMARDIISVVFRCTLEGGHLTVSDESEDVRWLYPRDVASLMSDAYSCRLLDAVNKAAPPVRTHDGHSLV